MACQGGFKQCCPSGACEGSLGGQRVQIFFCWSLTFTAQALVPASLSGSWAPEEDSEAWLQPVHVTDPQLTSENWILCSYLYSTHTDSLLFPSLPKPLICWGHPMPHCHSVPDSEQVQGGIRGRWAGGQPGFFSHSHGNWERFLWYWWGYAGMNLKVLSLWLNLGFAVWWPSQSSPTSAWTCPDWPRWMSSCSGFPRLLWVLIEWWCFW